MKKKKINIQLEAYSPVNMAALRSKIKQLKSLILKVKAKRHRYMSELNRQNTPSVKDLTLLDKALDLLRLKRQRNRS